MKTLGCIIIIMIFIILSFPILLIILIAKILNKKKITTNPQKERDNMEIKFNKTKVYWKAKSILTENERVFYSIVAPRLAKDHILLCKVRMEDIMHVDFNLKSKSFSEYQRARGRMNNRHFDFVICDSKTQEIQRVIELDGWTHRKDSEQEADKFKDEACADAEITLVRIDYQEMNYPEKMLEKISNPK